MLLRDKVAIVTGGAGGIGRAACRKFGVEGARVVVADIAAESAHRLVEELRESGIEALALETDVSQFEQVESTVAATVERYGRLDIMFNNAGVGLMKPLLDQTPDAFDRVVKVNQYGTFYGIVAAGRAMRDFKIAGTIINTASVYAYLASSGVAGYQASKGAIKIMTQVAALELAPYGIRVVAVAPGAVDTPMMQGYKEMGLEKSIASKHMRKQWITPEQVANVAAWLASDDADGINGSVVMVDDGLAEFK